LNQLGREAAELLQVRLERVFQRQDRALLLTHTPPFREVCRGKDHIADDEWAPHFVCQEVGDALVETMKARPEKSLLVLAGHAHCWADEQMLPNLRAITGGCELGAPRVEATIWL